MGVFVETNEIVAMTMVVILVAVFLIYILLCIAVEAITVIKDAVFPPCVDCVHCKVDGCYSSTYRCNKYRSKVEGEPEQCYRVRGKFKCKFEEK